MKHKPEEKCDDEKAEGMKGDSYLDQKSPQQEAARDSETRLLPEKHKPVCQTLPTKQTILWHIPENSEHFCEMLQTAQPTLSHTNRSVKTFLATQTCL